MNCICGGFAMANPDWAKMAVASKVLSSFLM